MTENGSEESAVKRPEKDELDRLARDARSAGSPAIRDFDIDRAKAIKEKRAKRLDELGIKRRGPNNP